MINPWPIGQLSTMTILLSQESKTVDLTTASAGQISIILYSQNTDGTYTLIGASTGTVAITQNKPGIITFTPASADVSSAGTFAFRVKINWGGTTPQFFDYIPWIIQA